MKQVMGGIKKCSTEWNPNGNGSLEVGHTEPPAIHMTSPPPTEYGGRWEVIGARFPLGTHGTSYKTFRSLKATALRMLQFFGRKGNTC